MNPPSVTVFVSTYNREQYLKECIDSVLAQTFADFEFLIIDDASTDGTEALVNAYKDPRIRYIKQKKNRRLAYESNYAFSIARGRYIAKIDSDDAWEPEKLEKQYAYMEAHPECGVCFAWAKFVNDDGEEVNPGEKIIYAHRHLPETQKEWMRHLFTDAQVPVNPSFFMRREVYETAGPIDVRFQVIEDYEYWIRVISRYPIYVYPEELVRYRWNVSEGQMSAATYENLKEWRNLLAIIRYHYFDWMSDENFVDWFGDWFEHADSRTEMELRCEKAFLQMKHTAITCDMTSVAAMMLGDIMRDGGIDVLEDKFGFTAGDYHQLMKSFCIGDVPGQKPREVELEEARNHSANLQAELDAIKSTSVWKLRCKLRSLLGKK